MNFPGVVSTDAGAHILERHRSPEVSATTHRSWSGQRREDSADQANERDLSVSFKRGCARPSTIRSKPPEPSAASRHGCSEFRDGERFVQRVAAGTSSRAEGQECWINRPTAP